MEIELSPLVIVGDDPLTQMVKNIVGREQTRQRNDVEPNDVRLKPTRLRFRGRRRVQRATVDFGQTTDQQFHLQNFTFLFITLQSCAQEKIQNQ